MGVGEGEDGVRREGKMGRRREEEEREKRGRGVGGHKSVTHQACTLEGLNMITHCTIDETQGALQSPVLPGGVATSSVDLLLLKQTR